MASLIARIRTYLSSPQGRRNLEKAKTMARDPRNQQKARGLLARLRGGRSHHPTNRW
ncbi:hypothetical protein Ppa06_41320 [Planomonospora parontospora subsp. parontospora]|uniref:Uncharacterized protein n=2 Tax=Planomonospora parontospora TaxID=58119 RepID=A0AA37F668_9ACTN|nr:hypothetical protein [Planomonospora parontospora]GGK78387.1 hypothetical protein GCM10010126_42200 [Planomonospora parontospora]GII10334.1 hypothetical protein Ppa06_41320 [Planomonospora parontospora subsp. parontospora]